MGSYFFYRDTLESDDSNLEEPKTEQKPAAADGSFDSDVNPTGEEDNVCCYWPLEGYPVEAEVTPGQAELMLGQAEWTQSQAEWTQGQAEWAPAQVELAFSEAQAEVVAGEDELIPGQAECTPVGKVTPRNIPSTPRKKEMEFIMEKIEEEMFKIVKALSEDRLPVFTVKQNGDVTSVVKLTPTNYKKFTIITVIMSKAFTLMADGRTMTNRDLYYENVGLFGNQQTVNGAIEEMCRILEVTPVQLPFVASAKGLMAAGKEVRLCHKKRGVTEGIFMNDTATLVPDVKKIRGWGKLESNAKFVLIVEKDAIFHRLLEEGILGKFDPFILVTGKGYPDKCTRAFVSKLVKDLKIPAFALVDSDPYGFEIAMIYKWGSIAQNKFEAEKPDMIIPGLILLGVLPSELSSLDFSEEEKIIMTERDQRKLEIMLGRVGSEDRTFWKEEIEEMLELDYKLEIEAVACIQKDYLTEVYLKKKIGFHMELYS